MISSARYEPATEPVSASPAQTTEVLRDISVDADNQRASAEEDPVEEGASNMDTIERMDAGHPKRTSTSSTGRS
jgi:hypothetical protein